MDKHIILYLDGLFPCIYEFKSVIFKLFTLGNVGNENKITFPNGIWHLQKVI